MEPFATDNEIDPPPMPAVVEAWLEVEQLARDWERAILAGDDATADVLRTDADYIVQDYAKAERRQWDIRALAAVNELLDSLTPYIEQALADGHDAHAAMLIERVVRIRTAGDLEAKRLGLMIPAPRRERAS